MAKLFYFYGTTKKGIETMNFLEEKIVKEGVVKEGNILKVDSFLNHQMDVKLFKQMGEEFKKRFADKPINKILTVEASGIGIACIVMFLLYLQRSQKVLTLTEKFIMRKLSHLLTNVKIRFLCQRNF